MVVATRSFLPPSLTGYRFGGRLDLGAVVKARAGRVKARNGLSIDGRGYDLRRIRPAGALDILAIVPRYGADGGLGASIRQVFAVEPGHEAAIPGDRIRRVESPTRKQVARAVARAWRYPRGLLRTPDDLPAPAGVSSKYLAACKGRRMWAACGIFAESKAPNIRVIAVPPR